MATAGATAGLAGIQACGPEARASAESLKISIFSKHLQFLDWNGLAETAAEIGFDGVDLTVRPGGHVLPERVAGDLPKAVEIIRRAKLTIPMVTAGIVSTSTPHAETMIKTISGLGIPRYRWGGFQWSETGSIPDRIAELQREAARLAELNAKYKICAMYHTHSGTEVGASIWDLWMILKDLNHVFLGINYDLAHATIEGGLGGYLASFRLVAPLIKGIAVKDFRWGRDERGTWSVEWCPLGQGMVNFKRFLAMIKEARFSGPLQMHFEYPLGGAESGGRSISMDRARIVAAMRQDLITLRGWLRESGLA
jgi:sugar phosphate isomerase/epimerase